MPTPPPELRGWVRRHLLAWFRVHGRDFAWRHTKDPYQLLMAEMMVQRTRAAQAERVWKNFIERYPTVETANEAPAEELRDRLRPLGLQWRIENILGVIRALAADGTTSDRRLRSLPGVGHYAANSVGAIAMGSAAPVIDANVVRVYCRFFGIAPSDRLRRAPRFHEFAQSMLPRGDRASFNWALLDLGAQVCTPTHPRCDRCPLASRCKEGLTWCEL